MNKPRCIIISLLHQLVHKCKRKEKNLTRLTSYLCVCVVACAWCLCFHDAQAGQATETETLIPMLYCCSTLILVGDPNQLPPTVVSKVLQLPLHAVFKTPSATRTLSLSLSHVVWSLTLLCASLPPLPESEGAAVQPVSDGPAVPAPEPPQPGAGLPQPSGVSTETVPHAPRHLRVPLQAHLQQDAHHRQVGLSPTPLLITDRWGGDERLVVDQKKYCTTESNTEGNPGVCVCVCLQCYRGGEVRCRLAFPALPPV